MRDFEALYFIRVFFRILLAFTVVVALCLVFLEINDSVPFQNGEILAENPQLDVKAPFEAIPKSVFVKEGQNVKVGDTLMILYNEQMERDYKGTEQLAQSLRKTIVTIEELIRSTDNRMRNLIKERQLNEIAYRDKKEKLKNEMKSVTQKVDLNKKQLVAVALEKLRMDSILFKQQVISKLEMTNSFDNFSKYQSSMVESELAHKQMQTGASTLDNDFLRLQNSLDLKVIEIQERLKELEQQKTINSRELENAIRNHNFMSEQVQKEFVIARSDGVVQNLFNVKFSQNFVSKDQLLLSIVHQKDKFYARVAVPQRDMRYVKAGQPAHLKVEAFNFYSHGILFGRVAFVPESKPKEDFFVNVELPDETPFQLKAGYSLRGEIIIERLKLYQFILRKLFRKLEDSTSPPATPTVPASPSLPNPSVTPE